MFAVVSIAGGSALAQERFDLRDWSREAIEDSTAAKFECEKPKLCGEGSSVSARLMARPKEPLTVERQRAREAEIAKRMREQAEGRIKDVAVGETREIKVAGLPLIYTEKRVTLTKGGVRTDIAGVMTGRTKAYVVVSSGRSAEHVRSNFSGYARVVALILEQMAADAAASEAAKPK